MVEKDLKQKKLAESVLHEDEGVVVVQVDEDFEEKTSMEASDVFHGEETFDRTVTVEEEISEEEASDSGHYIVHDEGHSFHIEDTVVVVDPIEDVVSTVISEVEASGVFSEYAEDDDNLGSTVEDGKGVKVDIISPEEAKLHKKSFEGEDTVVVIDDAETKKVVDRITASPIDEEDFLAEEAVVTADFEEEDNK